MILEHDLDSLIGAAEQRLAIALDGFERSLLREASSEACRHADDSIGIGELTGAISAYRFNEDAVARVSVDADAINASIRSGETDYWPIRYRYLTYSFQMMLMHARQRGISSDGSLRRIATVFILIGYAIRVSQSGTAW
jgi:hypothetical protein